MSKRIANEVEIYADCSCSKKEFNELLQHLKDHVNIISFNTPAHVWSTEAGMQCGGATLQEVVFCLTRHIALYKECLQSYQCCQSLLCNLTLWFRQMNISLLGNNCLIPTMTPLHEDMLQRKCRILIGLLGPDTPLLLPTKQHSVYMFQTPHIMLMW